ncbi:hypothetical protein KDM41_13715 [bacterium]|nr:hypothetical protein [bacterium]
MYEDFEDLRDNCPARIRAVIAIDLEHDDDRRMADVWTATGNDEFRLYLNGAVSGFWEEEIRRRGGRSVPDDGLAIEIGLDSYSDVEMGSSLYLELMAYCGTEGVGDLAWKVFDDDHLERRFAAHLEGETLKLLGEHVDVEGVRCSVEVTEVEEI